MVDFGDMSPRPAKLQRWLKQRPGFHVRQAGYWICALGCIPACVLLAIWLILRFQLELPNLLNLGDPVFANTQLTSIATILASILGIVIAVLVIALEALKRTYAYHGISTVLGNRLLLVLVSLYGTTSAASVFVAGMLSSPLNPVDISLAHLIFGLFVAALGMLFPACWSIVRQAHSPRLMRALVDRIDHKAIREMDPAYGVPEHRLSTATNPIYVIGQGLARLIRDDDRVSARSALLGMTGRLVDLLQNTNEKRRTITAVLSVYMKAARGAIEKQDEGILYDLFDCLAIIHHECARSRASWDQLVELNRVLELVLEECTESGPERAAEFGVYKIGEIMREHLKANSPAEDDIWYFRQELPDDTSDGYKRALHWNQISRDYLAMIVSVVDVAIKRGKGVVVDTGIRCLIEAASAAAMLGNLGDRQKEEIVRIAYYHVRDLGIRSLDEGLYKGIRLDFSLGFFIIGSMLEKDAPCAIRALLEFGQLLVETAKRDALGPLALNDLGAMARGATRRVGASNMNRSAVRFCVDVFDQIRSLLEEHALGRRSRDYVECWSQVESIRKWLAKTGEAGSELMDRCSRVLKGFTSLEGAQDSLRHAWVAWPGQDAQGARGRDGHS